MVRARRVQHWNRAPGRRPRTGPEAETQSGPVGRRKEGAAIARIARVLRYREVRLCARRYAGGIRRPRARVLRHPGAPGRSLSASVARVSAAGYTLTARNGLAWPSRKMAR